MVSLFYAARGLWRIVANFIREAVRSSLLAVMHMVSVHIPVLIFLAVFVLAFSGFGLLVCICIYLIPHSQFSWTLVRKLLDHLQHNYSVWFPIAERSPENKIRRPKPPV